MLIRRLPTTGLTRPTITRLARTFQSTRARRCREQYMPLVAFCLRHFLADFIICMCEFDFRQAQLFATARTLLVLSASLMSFASRLFFGALSTCLRLRPRSTNEGLVMWWGLIVSLVPIALTPAQTTGTIPLGEKAGK